MRTNTKFWLRDIAVTIGLVVWAAAAPLRAQAPPGAAPTLTPPKTASEPKGFIAEPIPIERAVIFGERILTGNGAPSGLRLGFADVIPGAGWIAIGPSYRRWGARDRYVAEASASLSWRGYKTADVRFEMLRLAHSRVAAGAEYRWQDYNQISYFGEGPQSREVNVSEYRLRSKNVVGFATLRPVRWLGIGTAVGVLTPSVLPRSGAFRRDRPDTSVVFSQDPVFTQAAQPAYVTTELSLTADTRDFPAHPLRGSVLHLAAANYSDRDGRADFRRYEADVTQFVPIAGGKVVVALQGWFAGTETDGGFVPFYLEPALGGHNSLRSYPDYRFHDRNAAGLTIETRIALMTHLDVALFADGGNVAARRADLNLDKRSYGAGLRLHSRRQSYMRIDVARGDEGWRLVVRLDDPLLFPKLGRRIAAVPYLPK